MAAAALALAMSVVASAPARAAAAADCSAWMDPSKSPDERARALLAVMTDAEKLALLSRSAIWSHFGVAGYIGPNTTLCIPPLSMSDAGQGVGGLMTGTTAFPAGLSQAASWDPALQQAFGTELGRLPLAPNEPSGKRIMSPPAASRISRRHTR